MTYWDQALDPATYIERMTTNRTRFEENISTSTLNTDQLNDFGIEALRILVITEDFCSDSVQFIPPLINLASSMENVELRILVRPGYQEFADRYTNSYGHQTIPVIILIDADGHEIGHLLERPERVHQAIVEETLRFARENQQLDGIRRNYDRMPADTRALVKANSELNRQQNQQLWSGWLLEDLAGILTTSYAETGSSLSD